VGELIERFHKYFVISTLKGIILCYKNYKGENIIFQNKSYRLLLLGSVLGFSIPNLAQASGFALAETSASGQGNSYAGAAAHATDGSTVWSNPAGMMKLDRDQLVVVGHIISPSASFTNNGSMLASGAPLTGPDDDGGSLAFVPNLYWVKTINDSTRFGLGVNSPFGLATEYDNNWVGRYHGVLSDLKTVNINPSLAYRINDRFSIGGGLDIMLGTIELSSAIDFGSVCVAELGAAFCNIPAGANPQTVDGFADLSGDNLDNISTGFNLGITFEATNHTTVGLTYRSEIEMKVTGDADFTIPSNPTIQTLVALSGAFVDTGLKSTVDLPASLSLSASHQVSKFTILADISWTGWSSFQELRIVYDNPAQPDTVTTEEWVDTLRFALGFDYQYSDALILRTGVAFDETPVPSAERRTVRLPGNDRTWLSFGLTYLISKNMTMDVGYSHLFVDDAPINNQLESRPELEATITGEYEASVNILSAQLNWYY
jgi:long-chain fatty acid transport protein